MNSQPTQSGGLSDVVWLPLEGCATGVKSVVMM